MSHSEIEALREENQRLRARLAELEGASGGESAAFLRSVLAAAPAFIFQTDSDLRIRFINHVQPGLRLEDVVGHSAFEFTAPESHEVMRQAAARAHATGGLVAYDIEGTGAHGERAHYATHVAPIQQGHEGLCFVAVEVTELVRSREALAESQRKLELALRAAKIGLWSLDVATGEVEWDAAMKAMIGREVPLGITSYATELVHPDDRAAVAAAGLRSLETGTFESVSHRILRPDGTVRWMMTLGTVVPDASGKPARLVGVNVDVTEQRATEERLRQAQKMQAVGHLTAGVAHNFNNMLGAILPALELLREVVPQSHLPLLEDSVVSAERAADLIRKLMTFAGQRLSTRAPCDIAELAERMVSVCRRAFDRHIELELRALGEVPPIACDAAAVEQVLLNLLINARDAVRDRGHPSPRIGVLVDVVGSALGPSVRLRVEDDGPGLSERARAHAFEPFFTTKEVGAGTGLGLATSYAIVKEHGGTIEIDSEPGRGTTVSVLLPVAAAAPDSTPARAAAPEPRHRVVLLVEDEPPVQNVTRRMLERAGHEVIVAGTAKEALERLDPRIEVVLLDRSLPGSPGTSLVPALRARLPAARVLYYTGEDVSPAERTLVDGVIHKPPHVAELLAAVDAER